MRLVTWAVMVCSVGVVMQLWVMLSLSERPARYDGIVDSLPGLVAGQGGLSQSVGEKEEDHGMNSRGVESADIVIRKQRPLFSLMI